MDVVRIFHLIFFTTALVGLLLNDEEVFVYKCIFVSYLVIRFLGKL